MKNLEIYEFKSVVQVPANTVPIKWLNRDCVGFTVDTIQPTGHRAVYGKKEDHVILP